MLLVKHDPAGGTPHRCSQPVYGISSRVWHRDVRIEAVRAERLPIKDVMQQSLGIQHCIELAYSAVEFPHGIGSGFRLEIKIDVIELS